MEKNAEDIRIKRRLSALEGPYRASLKRLRTQIREKRKSLRQQAKRVGLSHTALRYLLRHKLHIPHRKTMLKVIRATARTGRRKKRWVRPPVGRWAPCSL